MTRNLEARADYAFETAADDFGKTSKSGGTKCTGGSVGEPVTFRELAKLLGELEQMQF